MNDFFSDFGLNEKNNYLAGMYSKKHGEAYLLHDDPVQLCAGLLIENLRNATGMIVIVRDDELAFVVKDFDNKHVAFIDFAKRDYSEAGKVFRDLELEYFGILIDCGKDFKGKKGIRKYRILSRHVNYCE